MAEKKNESIGALWSKTSKSGDQFFSGVLEIDGKKHEIVVFSNGYKKEEKHPDWRIYPSKPRDQKPEPAKQPDEFPDSIPF